MAANWKHFLYCSMYIMQLHSLNTAGSDIIEQM